LIVVAKPIILDSITIVVFLVLQPDMGFVFVFYGFIDWFNRLFVNILVVHHHVLEDESH
jgi:hypothetical protein